MAGDKAVSVASKPQLRGILHTQIKKNIVGAITLSIICGAAYKFLVADVRKRRYAEFYRYKKCL